MMHPIPIPVLSLTDFLAEDEVEVLRKLGLLIGKSVRISRGAKFVTQDVILGDGCRIDHGALLTGTIRIGHHVHIGAYASLFGNGGEIAIGSFSSVSPYGTVLTGTETLTSIASGPALIDELYRNPYTKAVRIGENCAVFAHSTVLPGCRMDEGSLLAAHSLLKADGYVPAYEVWGGVPAKFLRDRPLHSSAYLKELMSHA